MRYLGSVATRKHTMVGQKYFRVGGANDRLGWSKITKINSNSENFRGGKIAASPP